MTHFRMTTQSTHPWDADVSAGNPHKHVRAGRPTHHAATSLPGGRIVLLSMAVLIVVIASLLVALG